MWMSSQPKVMSNLGATNEKNANMITSGVLRTMVTYVAAAARITATGPTRRATRKVPISIDSTPATRNSATV